MQDIKEYYQAIILDHSSRPRNYSVLPTANRVGSGNNPMCGDKITVFLHVKEKRVVDISFQGSGCAISQASASLMTLHLKGRTLGEAEALFSSVHRLVTTGETGDDEIADLAVLAGVHQFPARIKCAMLGWHAALNAAATPEFTSPARREDPNMTS